LVTDLLGVFVRVTVGVEVSVLVIDEVFVTVGVDV